MGWHSTLLPLPVSVSCFSIKSCLEVDAFPVPVFQDEKPILCSPIRISTRAFTISNVSHFYTSKLLTLLASSFLNFSRP